MSINDHYDKETITQAIAESLDNFYTSLINGLNKLNIEKIMKRKNPYLFRAKAMNDASEIVEALITAFVSSSEETIFGNVFFEPIAIAAGNGHKSLAEGVDMEIHTDDTIYAIAVKSGTSVFNADSKKKQEQNFMAARKLAQQVKKRFVAIIGYGYGRKKTSNRGLTKIYVELAGQDFWEELTGDESFYKELIALMGELPEKYNDDFKASYEKAKNRLVKEFTVEFCQDDGSIDWEKLVEFNSRSANRLD